MAHPMAVALPPQGDPPVPRCPTWCGGLHDDADAIRVHVGNLAEVASPEGASLFLVGASRTDERVRPGRGGWRVGPVLLNVTVAVAVPAGARTVEDLTLPQVAALADVWEMSGGHPLDVPALLRQAVADAQPARRGVTAGA